MWFKIKNTCAEVQAQRILKQTSDTKKYKKQNKTWLPVTLYTPLTHGFAQSDHHKRNQANHLINKMPGNPNKLQQPYFVLTLGSPFSRGSYSELPEHPCPLPPPLLPFLQALVFGEGLLYKILQGEVEKIHFCVVAKLVLAM